MQIGLIGAGNMARALARGWGRPVLCFDPITERAQALVEEVGGRALANNSELAEQADLVVLCHKPAQLHDVAREVKAQARAVASILAGVSLEQLRADSAYPDCPVYRFIPSLPVEVRQGAVVQAAGQSQEPARDDAVTELFSELGTLVVVPDSLMDVATGLMSCAPAYVALVAEAQIDAGVRHGLPAAQGAELVVQTLAGTAELLRRRGYDTLAVRREVSSPGGITARGLDALERGGVRSAFSDALDVVLGEQGVILASARTEVAGLISTVIYVYIILIFAYIVIQLLFAAGIRPPYSRASDAVLSFLRDVCEPFLRLFRRLIPAVGGLDLSPMLAIITLEVANRVLVQGAIHG